MPRIIGTVEQIDQSRGDWLFRFVISGNEGRLWMGARTKDHKSLTSALVQQDAAPPERRAVWEIDYTETERRKKNGDPYTARDVVAAKMVPDSDPGNSPAAAAPAPVGNKDQQIARAVAFKGAIEIISASVTGKTQVTNLTATIAHLTDEYEAILTNSYNEPTEEIIEIAATVEQDSLFDEEI